MKNLKIFKLHLLLFAVIIILGNPFFFSGSPANPKEQTNYNVVCNSISKAAVTVKWTYPLIYEYYSTAVAISSDGEYIAATGYRDPGYLGHADKGDLYLFNNTSSIPVWNYSITSSFSSVAISGNGSYIVAGGGGSLGNVYLFNNSDSTPEWNHELGLIYDVWMSSDGYYIGAAGFLFNKTGPTRLWQASVNGLLLRMETCLNASYIAVTDNTHNLYLFNKSSTIPEWNFSFSENYHGIALSMSADGNYIAMGSDAVYLFNKNSSIPIWTYPSVDVDSIKITPDGNYIVAGTYTNRVYFFNRLSPTPVWSYSIGSSVKAVDVSDDGEHIVAVNTNGGIFLFTKADGKPIWSYESDGWSQAPYDYGLDISSDGKYILASGRHSFYLFEHDFSVLQMRINSPTENVTFGNSAPDYDLSITGYYDTIWYSIDNGITNITSGLTGAINQAEWNNTAEGIVPIRFYVNNSNGVIEEAEVLVQKQIPPEPDPEPNPSDTGGSPKIPGYGLILLLGICSVLTLIIIQKIRENT